MKTYNLTYKPFGESAILIEWPAQIDKNIILDIINFEKVVTKNQEVVETIIAYHSLTVLYQKRTNYSTQYKYRNSYEKKVEALKKVYEEKQEFTKPTSKLWRIPVCYDVTFGLDLEGMASEKQLSVEEIVALHTAPKYLLYFLGFQPGFFYLGGLHKQIHTPRKATPRLRVDKGSVGIGGEQTGVYPQESAGGWNIIGKSPIDFFDITKPEPCFAKAGDWVKFEPISLDTFCQINGEVADGKYHLIFEQL